MRRPGIIERAFELARSGDYPTVSELKRRIRSEGYVAVDSHLHGASISAALRKICVAARRTGQ